MAAGLAGTGAAAGVLAFGLAQEVRISAAADKRSQLFFIRKLLF
ncbi:hypothetical protein PN4B1_04120 [Paenibacillus naphthalenovorans]|nr:hypothetical protein PN4B1_04120 [Paenibacillus naphthalenovorans]